MSEEILNSRRLLFVSGAQGSGTTWTGRLIDAHPNAVCLIEPRTMHGIIAPMMQYQQSRNQNLAAHGQSHFNIKNQTVIRLSRQLFADLFADYDLSDTILIGEKTPENALGLRLIDQVFPGAQYVWLYRDLRDALMSRYKAAVRQNPNADFLEYAELYFREFGVPYINGFLDMQKRRPKRTFAMRYEDMLADPVSKVRELFTFLQLPTDDDILLNVLKTTGTASADATSLKDVPLQEPASRGRIGSWREHDCDAFQEIYARGAKQRNIEAGYDT
jgi:hypothetical protein